jgi:Fe-S oxidoreductase
MARQPGGSPLLARLQDEYEYDGIETCAVDGSCAIPCPVQINTGALEKTFRRAESTPRRGKDRADNRPAVGHRGKARPNGDRRRRHHPADYLGLTKTLERLAGRLAGDVLVPVGTTCCGTAGDRGLLHPELVLSATRDEKAGLDETPATRTSRSCSCWRN